MEEKKVNWANIWNKTKKGASVATSVTGRAIVTGSVAVGRGSVVATKAVGRAFAEEWHRQNQPKEENKS